MAPRVRQDGRGDARGDQDMRELTQIAGGSLLRISLCVNLEKSGPTVVGEIRHVACEAEKEQDSRGYEKPALPDYPTWRFPEFKRRGPSASPLGQPETGHRSEEDHKIDERNRFDLFRRQELRNPVTVQEKQIGRLRNVHK